MGISMNMPRLSRDQRQQSIQRLAVCADDALPVSKTMVATHAIERGLTLHPLLLCTDEMVYRGQKLDMSSIKCQCFN